MKTKIKYLLVLVIASFVFVGCCTTHSKTTQWEYAIVTWNATDSSTEFDKLGKEGWILVAVVNADPNPGQFTLRSFYFKRPKH